MEQHNLRVIVASEYPQARELLKGMVEKEEGTFFVGQAPDGTRAVTLAKNLRPDVAIIDSSLPYYVGMDSVRLSRMGGLDTAQTIYETVPNTCVIVITNLDAQVLTENNLSLNTVSALVREKIGGNTALKLQEICHEAELPEAPVFANIEVQPWVDTEQESDRVTEGAIFFGIAFIISGGFLIGTLILAPVGIVLVVAGVLALAFGAIRKSTSRLWRNIRREPKKAE